MPLVSPERPLGTAEHVGSDTWLSHQGKDILHSIAQSPVHITSEYVSRAINHQKQERNGGWQRGYIEQNYPKNQGKRG